MSCEPSASIKTPPVSAGSSIFTPETDEELGSCGVAAGRMDLLTVLAHELGHVLGFEHDTEPGHLMSENLAPGIRLLPIGAADDIDNDFTNPGLAVTRRATLRTR